MNHDSMLIDGKNNIYRSVFAGYADERFKSSGHDYFIIFLRFLSNYINKFRPKSVHMFWDAPIHTLWRKQLYPAYKEQRVDAYNDYYGLDVKSEIKRQMVVTIQMLKYLNVRQYFKDGQEADDLIYAFVHSNFNKQNLIVSSDGDFRQILFRFNNASMYNPLKKSGNGLEDKPERDPVLIKSFIGDKSDNISGYYQIGKVKVKPLVDDLLARKRFFESDKAIATVNGERKVAGDSVFNLNRLIIDLALCPSLHDNLAFVERKQTDKVSFDMKQLEDTIQRCKLRGVMSEINNLAVPFKHLQ
jgi:5'-3' exonuclease